MKKDVDNTKIAMAAGIIADMDAERDIEEAEMEERILQLEEEIARLKGGTTAQKQARTNAINERKAATEQKRRNAEARRTAVFIIMLIQAIVYFVFGIYMITHY